MSADGDVIVRPARPSDASAVTDLVHDAYRHYVTRIGRQPAPMSVDYVQAIADGIVWVVDVDDQVGGVIVLEDATDHVLIDNVAVRPTLQGRGVGSLLLEFAEQHARARGVGELRLYTNERMTENLAYYARRGYTEVDRRTEAGFRRVFFKRRCRSADRRAARRRARRSFHGCDRTYRALRRHRQSPRPTANVDAAAPRRTRPKVEGRRYRSVIDRC